MAAAGVAAAVVVVAVMAAPAVVVAAAVAVAAVVVAMAGAAAATRQIALSRLFACLKMGPDGPFFLGEQRGVFQKRRVTARRCGAYVGALKIICRTEN